MSVKASTRILSTTAYDAVIFDLDGVVTRTAKVHAAAWKRLFDDLFSALAERGEKTGEPFDIHEDYRRYVDGKPRYDGLKSFLESRNIRLPAGSPEDDPDQETVFGLGKRKNLIFHEILKKQGVETYSSTVEIIRRLRSERLKTAIVSSSKNCAAVLKAAGLEDLFDVKVDGLDSEELKLEGKPAPDIFLEAAALLGKRPERGVVVEDAISGVQAGRAGGFGLVIGIDRGNHRGALLKNGADWVVEDLSEVVVGETVAVSLSDAGSLPSPLKCRERIRDCAENRRLAVFLDYDGTLTPIVDRPEEAVLSGEMRREVARLSRSCPVGVISGRDLQDVRRLVALDSVVYAGSHGFDISGPDFSYRHGLDFLPALDRAERQLKEKLRSIAGVRVDRKQFAIAVHYRQVGTQDVQKVEKVVNGVLSGSPELRKSTGKAIFELNPDTEWDKGRALVWMLAKMGLDGPDVLPFYIGDDTTDEDAFRVLATRGVGVIVRAGSGPTWAQYALDTTEEVREFLMFLQSLEEF